MAVTTTLTERAFGVTATAVSRVRYSARSNMYPDTAAVLALLLLTVAAAWKLLVNGTIIGLDAATQFYPRFAYLGQRLWSGEIPMWSPNQFSGAPFAADPQSGWMYWPAMLLFTFLPLGTAAKGFLFLHLLLAGIFVYALGRLLGLSVPGAFLAAIAYEFNSFMYERNICCFTYTGIALWLPAAILAMELAIRSRRWLTTALWWGLAGLALSQTLAAWLGQGSYYALLALGGYIAYRTLVASPEGSETIRQRLSSLLMHGVAVLLFGFALAAAGILPRLEYNALSTMAGGYAGTPEAVAGGWKGNYWSLPLQRGQYGNWYIGGITLALAAVAPFVAGARAATPYWAVLSIGAYVLSGQGPTLLHSALYLLPGFRQLHPHSPERIMMVSYLALALLAGATLTYLREKGRKGAILALIPGGFVLILLAAQAYLPKIPDALTPSASLLALLLGTLFLHAYPLLPRYQSVLSAILIVVLFADLLAAGRKLLAEGPGDLPKVNLAEYFAPRNAGEFLRARAGEEQFRYFGYDRDLARDRPPGKLTRPYRNHFANPLTSEILVNNRATILGLEDVQGYNTVQLSRYAEFMRRLNREPQEYRSLYVLGGGLESPLLDLLNTRYIVVPVQTSSTLVKYLVTKYREAYTDGRVRILERPNPLPRAWLVHAATQVRPGEALEMLAQEKVDPRQVALIEQPSPPLARPADPSRDRVSVSSYADDRIELRVSTDAPGLLMLSEIYYPAWKAYVDGAEVPVLLANHVLRAVHVPAGEHTVELRYESMALRAGVAISLAAHAALLALVVAALLCLAKRRRTQTAQGR